MRWFLCFTLMTFTCVYHVTSGIKASKDKNWILPNFYKRLLIDSDTQQSFGGWRAKGVEPRCLPPTQACSPWSPGCCGRSQCVNFAQQFCLSEFEDCTCSVTSLQYKPSGKNSIWYRKRATPY